MIKLKEILKESYVWDRKFGEPLPTLQDSINRHKKLNENKRLHGFDLTDFRSGGFQKVLKGMDIKPKGKLGKSKWGAPQWEWKGDDILIVTANNPITGEYAIKNGRENEKNYASYIGIEGDADKVIQAVDLIKKYGSYKGESKGDRKFI